MGGLTLIIISSGLLGKFLDSSLDIKFFESLCVRFDSTIANPQ